MASFVAAVTWFCIAKHTGKNLGMLPEKEPFDLTSGLRNGWKSNNVIAGTPGSPGWCRSPSCKWARTASFPRCWSGFAEAGSVVAHGHFTPALLTMDFTPFLQLLPNRWFYFSLLQPKKPRSVQRVVHTEGAFPKRRS